MQRDRLGSRLGFLMLSAACAIGLGNVWKFPYMAGQYGGGAFVVVYLAFLVLLGIPVLLTEFTMGRAAQKSPVKMYQALEPKGSKWHIHGGIAMAGNYLLMMFYVNVAGWLMYYLVATATGKLEGLNAQQVAAEFGSFCSDPALMLVCMAAAVIIGFFICSFSLQKGLERITKYMMIGLFILMIVLAVNSFFMDGAREGLSFYLKPDFSNFSVELVIGAMTQAFFTLGLGIGAMAIFGSYIGKERSLLGESVNVVILDTIVAITAGLIIFPACFSYGVEVTSGPPLIFITLPNIFANLPLGRLWGSLFFLFMCVAAISTVLATFENIMACCIDLFGWSRKKAALINCIAMLILATPCALGFNLWSGFAPLGDGSTIQDLEDFIVSNNLLPLGSLLYLLFCTSKHGWGWDNFITEADTGTGLKFPKALRFYVSYILPLLILFIFIMDY